MTALFTTILAFLAGVAADYGLSGLYASLLTLWSNFIPHMATALMLGFLIGLERRSRNKSIGARTFMILAGSSAMIAYFGVTFGESHDPTRLPAAIFSGISWIGIAITFRRQGGFHNAGVTTAAMMLMAVGAGIGCGLGLFGATITGILMLLIAITITGRMIRSNEFSPPVTLVCLAAKRDEILSNFGKDRTILRFEKLADTGWVSITFQPTITGLDSEELIEGLIASDDVRQATQEAG
jgi:uncharacterized membrane protein YhiD involved in acid resistance